MAKQPETIIEWQAPEFRHYTKSAVWFIMFAVIVAAIIIYMLVRKDFFGAITFAIISAFIAAFAMHKPKMVTIGITTHGIHIDDSHIPYTHIKQFWIVDNDHHKTLNIETTAYINHLLTIELHEQDSDEVQEILQELLPEKPTTHETPVQKISHRLKF